MAMRRLLLSFLVAATASMATAGCDRSVPPFMLAPTDSVGIAGSYGLNLANGRILPILGAVITSTDQYDLAADQMILSADGTWSETTTYNVTSFATNGVSQQHTVTSGTYAVGAGVITFTRVAGGALTFTGSVTGNTLTLILNGQFIYTR
jgi:hypothetical protein